MRTLRPSGLVAYAAMAMWLLQLAISPVRADDTDYAQSRVGDHVAEIRAALLAAGATESVKINLAAPDTIVAINTDGLLVIDSISFNPASGRFLARAKGAPDMPLIAFAGTAKTPVLIPVPTRSIERNEIIAEIDIDWIETVDTHASQFVDDADAIIGKIARRPLAAGAPLRKADLMTPVAIKRGATATVVLDSPGIRLTQNAVALENGGIGDLIAFRNINSDREIKAVVTGSNTAKAPFAARSTVAALTLDQ